MCTLSIISSPKERIITMNRDEQTSRHEAENIYISQVSERGDVVGFYPVDSYSNGTWFGCNTSGVVLSLLNRYQNTAFENRSSRGNIIPRLLKFSSAKEVIHEVEHRAWDEFNPFDLVLISYDNIFHFSWSGVQTKSIVMSTNSPFFLTSSSTDTQNIIDHRKQIFRQYLIEKNHVNNIASDILHDLHLVSDKDNSSRSIFMQRDNSHTKSICQVRLTHTQVEMTYFPHKCLKKLSAREVDIDAQHIDFNLL